MPDEDVSGLSADGEAPGPESGSRRAHPRLTPLPGGGLPGASVARACDVAARLLGNLERVVVGKRRELRLVVCALACEGHVLFEDVPGTAKTVLARALAGSVAGASVARIQCTPDLQPADVTGSLVFDQRSREFVFRPGPIFANVVLLDEVNRATPKTQAALLEAMAERQVTVDGVTRPLPVPFLLLATENPVEHEGTFVLPEAELDRFFLRTSLGYPSGDDEIAILRGQAGGHPLERLAPVVDLAELGAVRAAVEDVYLDELIERWIVDLVRATRTLDVVDLGSSVRGSIALERAVRAWALLDGRDYVTPEDVEALFLPVVAHRILFTPAFVSASRTLGRDHALSVLWARCVEAAPRPGDEP
jgi:MoxR-like ATPase